MSDIVGTVVVHFDPDGELDYAVFGDERIRLFIVDDRAPHDRVYEWLPRRLPAELASYIPTGTEIGSSADDRHEAIAARINAVQDNRPHLSVVKTPEPGDAA